MNTLTTERLFAIPGDAFRHVPRDFPCTIWLIMLGDKGTNGVTAG